MANNTPKLVKVITEAERVDAGVEEMARLFASLAEKVESINSSLKPLEDNLKTSFSKTG